MRSGSLHNNLKSEIVNWGKSIVLAFALFVIFIGTLVTVCVRQDISLVTRDYYKEELAYQQQIDRISHTARLSIRPALSVEHGYLLKVDYADLSKVDTGELELFRPSDAAMDKRFKLTKTAETSVYFSTSGMEKGMYRARLRWTMDGEQFFLEQVIHL